MVIKDRWRYVLERRGKKASCSKTEHMYERNPAGTVRPQGAEVKRVEDSKYLGSRVQSKEVKKDVQRVR